MGACLGTVQVGDGVIELQAPGADGLVIEVVQQEQGPSEVPRRHVPPDGVLQGLGLLQGQVQLFHLLCLRVVEAVGVAAGEAGFKVLPVNMAEDVGLLDGGVGGQGYQLLQGLGPLHPLLGAGEVIHAAGVGGTDFTLIVCDVQIGHGNVLSPQAPPAFVQVLPLRQDSLMHVQNVLNQGGVR